jgi:hypothetical protein
VCTPFQETGQRAESNRPRLFHDPAFSWSPESILLSSQPFLLGIRLAFNSGAASVATVAYMPCSRHNQLSNLKLTSMLLGMPQFILRLLIEPAFSRRIEWFK